MRSWIVGSAVGSLDLLPKRHLIQGAASVTSAFRAALLVMGRITQGAAAASLRASALRPKLDDHSFGCYSAQWPCSVLGSPINAATARPLFLPLASTQPLGFRCCCGKYPWPIVCWPAHRKALRSRYLENRPGLCQCHRKTRGIYHALSP